MKRMLKKLFPVFLLATSLLVVYLNDSGEPSGGGGGHSIYAILTNSSSTFSIQENDVIVLLDIPSTGMTSLSQNLVKDLITKTPCACLEGKTRCSCRNEIGNQWLFQSYNSTGYVCGEHADWTALTECPIDQWMANVGHDTRSSRRYWMLTLLREPIARFVGEWHHFVTRDAYFRNEPRLFRKESPELQKKELECWVGKKIATLSLRDFVNCEENPALNRMTRMLANLTRVKAMSVRGDEYDSALLKSAMENLEKLPVFGISEKSTDTQKLLKATLGISFSREIDLLPRNLYKSPNDLNVPADVLRVVRTTNSLDVRLYNFAVKLFEKNVEQMDISGMSSSPDDDQNIRKDFAGNNVVDNQNDDDYDDDDDVAGNNKDDDTRRNDNGEDDDDEDDDADQRRSDKLHEEKMNIDESDLDNNRDSYSKNSKTESESGLSFDTENKREFKDNKDEYLSEINLRMNDEYDGGDDEDDNVIVPIVVPKDKPIGEQMKNVASSRTNSLKLKDEGDDDNYENNNVDNIDNYRVDGNKNTEKTNSIEDGNDLSVKEDTKTEINNNNNKDDIGLKYKPDYNKDSETIKKDKNSPVQDTEDVNEFLELLEKEKSKKQQSGIQSEAETKLLLQKQPEQKPKIPQGNELSADQLKKMYIEAMKKENLKAENDGYR